MTRALLLDRDGVVNRDIGYLYRLEEVEFIDGVFMTCRAFQRAGFRIVIVTNQSGIARGYFTVQDFETLTTWMRQCFEAHGVRLDGVYYCPHHPSAGSGVYARACRCRKPQPGLIVQAARELSLDLAQSLLVGDKRSDLEAGRRAGVGKVVLTRSGHPTRLLDEQFADLVVDNLGDTQQLMELITC